MTYQTTALAALIALFVLAMALLFGLSVTGNIDAASTPLGVTILTGIATTVAALLAVIRADRNVEETKRINGRVENLEDVTGTRPPPDSSKT